MCLEKPQATVNQYTVKHNKMFQAEDSVNIQ